MKSRVLQRREATTVCAVEEKEAKKFPYSFYDMLFFFFFYACAGWICEVIFAFFRTGGAFINRGFLTGPVCPIYGFGILAVLLLCEPFRKKPLAVFALSATATTALELMVGVTSVRLLHTRLWNYSYMPLNLDGHICLAFSLIWGVACLAIFYGIHPLVARLVKKIPRRVGMVILFVCSAAILGDLAVHGIQIIRANFPQLSFEMLLHHAENVRDLPGKLD